MAGRRYRTREQLIEAIRVAALTNPGTGTQEAMARAVGVGSRTWYRLRRRFDVPWPPFDDWEQVMRRSGGVELAEAESRQSTTWLVTFTVREVRWITAASAEEAIATLRAEIGPRPAIVSIQPA